MNRLDDLRNWVGETAAARRELPRAEMARLERTAIGCAGCSGICCTLVANSMQTTPAETLDLLVFLIEEGRWNKDLIQRLRATVRSYRLDVPIPGDGRRGFLRRTYTCPFFAETSLGCTIAPSHKPYGCLAFNPERAGVTEGEACSSNQALLERRERETVHHGDPMREHALDWDKKPMPLAMLALAEVLGLLEESTRE